MEITLSLNKAATLYEKLQVAMGKNKFVKIKICGIKLRAKVLSADTFLECYQGHGRTNFKLALQFLATTSQESRKDFREGVTVGRKMVKEEIEKFLNPTGGLVEL